METDASSSTVPSRAGEVITVSDTDTSPPRGNPFPIVGIGASAGGLGAFIELISALPIDTGMAFVLVQHLDPQHASLLPELLATHSPLPVISVSDGLKVEPDHIYVIPPNTSMELADGTLRLVSREPGLHLPIDIFFRSLAAVQGSRSIGVVLSGNASDGSVGVRDIKAECGITFAQDEASARFGGMPRNAVATGAVDYVLSPSEIARELTVIAKHPFLIPSRPSDPSSETLPVGEGSLRRIFTLLHNATKVDFSRYKPATVRRRIGRRMMVLRIDTLAEYTGYVEHHPSELGDLYRDLLISVTSFFRDPDSFEALAELIAASLASRGKLDEPIRVWAPGCATGEEAYSLAICFYELLMDRQLHLPIQLFGTDISDVALDRARRGLYPVGIEEDLTPERLYRFFTKVDHGYQINKTIRECCIFARHDLTRDPPFSNLDLISCRNLLIYLDQNAQRHVLPLFHYALKPGGLLMLGSAESTGSASDLFIAADQPHKIYKRSSTPPRLPASLAVGGSLLEDSVVSLPSSGALDLQKKLDRVIQSKYSPDAVLINNEFQIVQFRGHTSAYLNPSPGQASLNVLRMAREELLLPLRRAVHSADITNAPARETGVELEAPGQTLRVTLEVTPLAGSEAGERYFLIVFVREPSRDLPAFTSVDVPAANDDEHISKLERELAETREYLRSIAEQYEAHSEELRAANEEARSANEELQSTNEELRTTKEELQSANEELTTVNEELQGRNQELNATNSDLKNFLGAITMPILIIDSDLRVRRFNAAAGTMFDLGPLDVGRPVGHIRGRIETPRLDQQVRNVIEMLHPISEELQDSDGSWYSLAIRPYRTIDDRIAGAVITLQDIDPLKRGLQAAEDAREYAEGVIETVREPLIVLDSDLRVQRATRAFYDTFLVTREETEGRLLYDLGNGEWNRPRLRELIGSALFRSEPFLDFEIEHEYPHIGHRVMRLNGRRIPFPHSQRRMLLLSIEDVTLRRELAETRYRRLFETAKDGIVVIDAETYTIQDVNPYFLQLTGRRREELIGQPAAQVGAKLGIPQIGQVIDAAKNAEFLRYDNLHLLRADQQSVVVDVTGNQYLVGNRPVVQFNIRDVSSRQQAANALHKSEQLFRLFIESVRDYAMFQMNPAGEILSWNSGAERLLGWKEQEVLGRPGVFIFTPEDIAAGAAEREFETARSNGRAEDERWHIRKDGSRFFASGVLTQVCDENSNLLGFAKVMRDVTASKQHDEQLRRSLSEKDTLVREIHHRVKNNLQVIVSLLSMQSRHTQDAQVLAAFREAESRLRAIAHIHERLYASEDLTEVEFGGYVTILAKELTHLHAAAPNQIRLELDVTDLVLHIERAIPLGLIANELILNGLKHGLRSAPGTLSVKLIYLPAQNGNNSDREWGQLQVSDSGPGFPPNFEMGKTTSMGLRLVNMLVRQLRGRIESGPGPGANMLVSFPLEMDFKD